MHLSYLAVSSHNQATILLQLLLTCHHNYVEHYFFSCLIVRLGNILWVPGYQSSDYAGSHSARKRSMSSPRFFSLHTCHNLLLGYYPSYSGFSWFMVHSAWKISSPIPSTSHLSKPFTCGVPVIAPLIMLCQEFFLHDSFHFTPARIITMRFVSLHTRQNYYWPLLSLCHFCHNSFYVHFL